MKVGGMVFVYLVSSMMMSLSVSAADRELLFVLCDGMSGNYTLNSTYQNNLNALLSSLSSNVNDYGFYNASAGQSPDKTSVVAMCRGDVELSECRKCVDDAAKMTVQSCPTQKEAFGGYSECTIRYSNNPIIGSNSNSNNPVKYLWNWVNVTSMEQFDQDLRKFLDGLVNQAANGGSFLKFAAGKTTGPDSQPIYALVQCIPDLSAQECSACLNSSFEEIRNKCGICYGKTGAGLIWPSCNYRYDTALFFGDTLIHVPPASSPLPLLPPPQLGKKEEDDHHTTPTVLFVVVPVILAVVVMVTIIVCIVLRKRPKRRPENGGIKDPDKRGYLDWERRYNIIENIARGLVYLHEDSRLRIIHRDLKANNILLDADLNPKIADFGMAKLFALNQSHGSTDRLVGAHGYIAPEYARYGKFSEKSDVYSFGVLVLEIISGQKNTIQNGESTRDLLFEVWTHWKKGAISNVIDLILQDSSKPRHEIKRCIHVALLCVQESVQDRPKMSRVLQMLSRDSSLKPPEPLDPGFFSQSSGNS